MQVPPSVTAGRLSVNGTLQSPVTVSSGATLGGTGTLSKLVTIQSGGSLTPGNSIAPITIATLTLDPAPPRKLRLTHAVFRGYHHDGAHGQWDLHIVADSGTYNRRQTYNILSRGPFTGTFSGLQGDRRFSVYLVKSLLNLIQLMLRSGSGNPHARALGKQQKCRKLFEQACAAYPPSRPGLFIGKNLK